MVAQKLREGVGAERPSSANEAVAEARRMLAQLDKKSGTLKEISIFI